MKFIFRYLKPRAWAITAGLIIKICATIVELAIPMILSYILEKVVPNDGRISMVLFWGLMMVVCASIALICNVTANRMAARIAKDASENIRHDLFDRIMHLSGRQTDAFTIPSLEARVTTDTYNVHHFIGIIQRMGVRAPIMLIGGLIITLIMDPVLSLIMFAMLPPP